jgi:hypothetical protein
MADNARRIDIGFQGGQVLPCRVNQEDFDALRKALSEGSDERWHTLSTLDSEVSLDLSQVVYVRMDSDDQKVGF